MSQIEVEAKVTTGKDDEGNDIVKEGKIPYDFGDSLSEMIDKFGDETVFSNARANMKVQLQARMRSFLKENKDVNILTSQWKPGVQTDKIVDVKAAALDMFKNASDEEKANFINMLQQLAGAQG